MIFFLLVFHIFSLKSFSFSLDAIVTDEFPGSFIGQMLQIRSSEEISKIYFSLGQKKLQHLFMIQQIYGPDLINAPDKSGTHQTNKWIKDQEKNQYQRPYYSYIFKIMSNFTSFDVVNFKVATDHNINYNKKYQEQGICTVFIPKNTFNIFSLNYSHVFIFSLLLLFILLPCVESMKNLLLLLLVFLTFLPKGDYCNVFNAIVILLIFQQLKIKIVLTFITCYLFIYKSPLLIFPVLLSYNNDPIQKILILLLCSYLSMYFDYFPFTIPILLFYYFQQNVSMRNKTKQMIASFALVLYVLLSFTIIYHIFNETSTYNSVFYPTKYKNEFKSDKFIATLSPLEFRYDPSYAGRNSFVKDMVLKTQQNFSLANCELCSFKVNERMKGDSTERDVIVIVSCMNPTKAYLGIKSLRTVGCKARVFLIIDQIDELDYHFQKEYENCGVFVFKLDNTLIDRQIHYENVRFDILSDFGESVGSNVDRILYYDAFDTIFQGDPFYREWEPNSLYVSSEKHQLIENIVVRSWFTELEIDMRCFLHKDVICSGVFGGSPKTISLISKFVKSLNVNLNIQLRDQVLYDYILFLDIPSKLSINVINEPHFASIAFNYIKYSGTYPEIVDDIDFKPRVVHQINRNEKLFSNSIETCHIIL